MTRLGKWLKENQSVVVIALLLATIAAFLVRDRYESIQARAANAKRQVSILGVLKNQQKILDLVHKQQEEEARAGKIRQEQLDRLTELAAGLRLIAERTEVVARQVPDCFKPPNGQCVKASAASLERIRKDQEDLLKRTSFVAVNPARPGETSFIVTPEVHKSPVAPPCQDTISLGNQAVLPGLLCTKP